MEIVEEGGITGFMDGIALYNQFPKDPVSYTHLTLPTI